MLLLALVAMLPGISIVAGLLLVVPALEMIAGRVAPVFPRRFLSLPTRYLARAVRRAHPGSEVSREGDPSALAHSVGGYQKCRRRRSPATDRAATARAGANDPGRAGFGDRVNLTGHLEEDEVLHSIALLIAVALLAITGAAVWKMVAGAV